MKNIYHAQLYLFYLIIFLLIPLSTHAKILVISPHPDDDVIMASGVIYRALQRGEPVRVVYMTNGDAQGISSGYARQIEAVNGQDRLGMNEDDLIFLGYPDTNLDELYSYYQNSSDVFTSSHGQSTTYGNRGIGRSDFHTYFFGAPANYNAYNVILDLEAIINTYRPDHIFVTSGEGETHSDHRDTYNFMSSALSEVFSGNPDYNPTVHKTLVHVSNHDSWPNPPDPTVFFDEPVSSLPWNERESLDVPICMQSWFYPENFKHQAIDAHESEDGGENLLGRFIHKDEIFWVEQHRGTNQPPVVDAGLDKVVVEGVVVQLDGSGSFDHNDDSLSYQWRQVGGTPVVLSSPNEVNPEFTTPASLPADEILTFELVVSDGELSAVPDAVNVIVRALMQPTYSNIAPITSSVTASTIDSSSAVLNAIDGCIGGYPGDSSCEWVTYHEGSGAWIELNWNNLVTIGKIAIYDRPNYNDNIISGTISFSDGSTINVGPLEPSGHAVEYTFSPREIINLRLTINSVGNENQNTGLSEIMVFEVVDPGSNRAPIANSGADQTVNEGELVQLVGDTSYDPDGDEISYEWSQTGGISVELSDVSASNPTFTAPTGLSGDEAISFELVVNDGELDSSPDSVIVTVRVQSQDGVNIAPLATVIASSENTSTDQLAIKAVDEYVDGYPGDYTREWATIHEGAGAWIELTWSYPHIVDRVVFHDRPNSSDQVMRGTISFSDGSSIDVGPLENYGEATEYTFAAREIMSLRLTVNEERGSNIGLSEIMVFEVVDPGSNRAPIANSGADQTVNEGELVQLVGDTSYDPDGDEISYEWSQTGGISVELSDVSASNPTFTAPTGLSGDEAISFELVVNDGELDSSPDSVIVTVVAEVLENRAPVANSGADQTVNEGELVQLVGDTSYDPDGDEISYEWSQTGGISVELSDVSASNPTFTAPTGLSGDEAISFELVVNDGELDSSPDSVIVTVRVQSQDGVNIAPLATVIASSENTSTDQLAIKAVDEYVDGYPGDYTREWATIHEGAGAWIELTWSYPHIVDRVVFHDRPNSSDQVMRGTISFSDGSSIDVGPLENYGEATEYTFAAREIMSLRLTVNEERGSNIGLSEIMVFEVVDPGSNRAPIANSGADQTVNEGELVQLVGDTSYDPDGDEISYEWSQTGGISVELSDVSASNPTFTAPTGLSGDEAISFELVVNDGELDSSPDSVIVTVRVQSQDGVNIAPLATVIASSENTSTDQLAIKAVDEYVDGYPGDYTREWATIHEGAGAWIELTWSYPHIVDRVVFHDRPNSSDQVMRGTISFSDGSSIDVGPLENYGEATEYTFAAREIMSLRLTVNEERGSNIGLSEIMVFEGSE